VHAFLYIGHEEAGLDSGPQDPRTANTARFHWDPKSWSADPMYFVDSDRPLTGAQPCKEVWRTNRGRCQHRKSTEGVQGAVVTTILFWLAIPVGLSAFPVSLLGYVLLPISLISLVNQFAAPRQVLLVIILINVIAGLPPVRTLCGRLWRIVTTEDDFQQGSLLGSSLLSSVVTVGYLTSKGWIGTEQSTWLLTAYWFLSLTQLWNGAFLLIGRWITRQA